MPKSSRKTAGENAARLGRAGEGKCPPLRGHRQARLDRRGVFPSGEQTVAEEILTDMINICQGKDPKQMRVLEIGCGAGRITRALPVCSAKYTASMSAARWSLKPAQALADARMRLSTRTTAWICRSFRDGPLRLRVFHYRLPAHPEPRSDLQLRARSAPAASARSAFQIPGAGRCPLQTTPDDTWLGVPFSDADAVEMAEECGFEPRYRHGAGEQYFWLWYFKKHSQIQSLPYPGGSPVVPHSSPIPS